MKKIPVTNNLKDSKEEYMQEFFMHMYVHITEALVCAKIVGESELEHELDILYQKMLKIRTKKYGHVGDRWIRGTK